MTPIYCEIVNRTFMGAPLIKVVIHEPRHGIWHVTCADLTFQGPTVITCQAPDDRAWPVTKIARDTALSAVDWAALK